MIRTTTSIGSRLPHPLNPASSYATNQSLVPFSTFSGSGGDGHGRGRGRGGPTPRFSFVPPPRPGLPPNAEPGPEGRDPRFDFAPPRPPNLEPGPDFALPRPRNREPGSEGRGRRFDFATPQYPNPESGRLFSAPRAPGMTQETDPGHGSGHGRGRGGPAPPSSPVLPSFTSFVSAMAGRGRGGIIGGGGGDERFPFHPGRAERHPPPPEEIREPALEPNRHVRLGGGAGLPESIAPPPPHGGGGAGRGWPVSRFRQQQEPVIQPEEVNRHARPPQWKSQPRDRMPAAGAEQRGRAAAWASRGAGGRGMAMARGRGGWVAVERGRGRGRGRGMARGRQEMEEESRSIDLRVGDDADGECFASRVGPEVMRQLEEGFEEVVSRAMPSRVDEAYLNALDMNYRLEFEPEFLMGDLDSNPDIDEKEPIPLRDALEKAKPFLMAYEEIESHEEWEEIVEETMERVPVLKKIVDHYSGPERITAKKQNEELERVAKTLPESVPNSIRQFTDRAVLSLQSNPGWGFHRKRQFMDKLVSRMSQHYN